MLSEKNTTGLGIKVCGNWPLASAVPEVFVKDPFYYFVMAVIN